MREAPERIWAFPKNDWFNAGASTYKIKAAGAKDVEYIRADLVEAAVKRALERAAGACVLSGQDLAEGDWGPEGRDMAVMLERRILRLNPAQFVDGEK